MNFLVAALGVLGVASSGPLIAGTLGATSVTALAIAFWRNAIAAVVMASPVLVREPRQFRKITRYEFTWSAVAAVALAFHFASFITALQFTSVAAATALVRLQSAWIAVFQLLRGTRHGWPVLMGLGIALGGVAAIVAVLALTGGQPLAGFDAGGWLGIVAITVCAQLVGHTAFNHLLATMSPLLVSMIILLEIPGAALLAAVFLHETLPTGTYAGLALILAGLAVVVAGQRRGPSADDPPGKKIAELGTD